MSKRTPEFPLEQLSRQRAELPYRQRCLAEFILEHHRQLFDVSAQRLAQLAGVSESTISRLIRHLGYTCFADFARGITDYLRGSRDSSDWLKMSMGTSPEEALAQVIETEVHELERLAQEFPASRLSAAVGLLSQARQVFVLGAQSSSPLALSAAYELGKIRERVHRIRLSEEDAAHLLADASGEDCALVFGFARYPRRVMTALTVLQRRQVPIVVIAHADAAPTARLATISLPVHLRYYMLSPGYSPVSALLNALIAGVYQNHPQRSNLRINEFERTIDTTQIFDVDI